MGLQWRPGKRRSATLTGLAAILLALTLLGSCSPRSEDFAVGWRVDGKSLPDPAEISVAPSLDSASVTVRLPPGFTAADGFRQVVTISDGFVTTEIELPELGRPVHVPLVTSDSVFLTISIGFCTLRRKDVCYVDRGHLVITREGSLDHVTEMTIEYSPEDPT